MLISRRSSPGVCCRTQSPELKKNDVFFSSRRLLHTYVAVHGGTFDGQEKTALKAFLDAKRAGLGEGGGELALGADELRVLESALA